MACVVHDEKVLGAVVVFDKGGDVAGELVLGFAFDVELDGCAVVVEAVVEEVFEFLDLVAG
jgi:hypothetical protein